MQILSSCDRACLLSKSKRCWWLVPTFAFVETRNDRFRVSEGAEFNAGNGFASAPVQATPRYSPLGTATTMIRAICKIHQHAITNDLYPSECTRPYQLRIAWVCENHRCIPACQWRSQCPKTKCTRPCRWRSRFALRSIWPHSWRTEPIQEKTILVWCKCNSFTHGVYCFLACL